MALTPLFDIGIYGIAGNTQFKDAFSYSGNLYTVESGNNFRIYNLANGQQINTSLAIGSNPSTICFVSPATSTLGANAASAVVNYGSANQYDLICLATAYKRTVTLTSGVTNNLFSIGQQAAFNPNTGVGFSTTQNNNFLYKMSVTDEGTNAAKSVSPGGALSGHLAYCILFKPDTSTWLVGTNAGQVFEMNVNGVIIQTLTLPTTPNSVVPTIKINGLSYANGIVAIASMLGTLYIYNWATQTEVTSFALNNSGSGNNNSITLCPAVSGYTIVAQASVNNYVTLSELHLDPTAPVFTGITTVQIATGGTVGMDATHVWFQTNANSLRLFNMSSLNQVGVLSRCQDPPNVEISSCRVIRILDPGVGKATVELDGVVLANGTALPAREDQNYIELALEGTGINEKWDIREFQA